MKRIKHKITTIVMAIAIIVTSVNPLGAEAVSKKKAALSKKSVTLTITNKKTAPAVTLKVKNAGSKKVKWTTSNKKVAVVKTTGKYSVKITAKKAGKANITCNVNGKKLVCKVIVKDNKKNNSNSNTDDADDNDTSEDNPDTVTPKCDHEWVEQWAVYEHEGDYNNVVGVCNCGEVFTSEQEYNDHRLIVASSIGGFSDVKMNRNSGIHGASAKGTPTVYVEGGIVHVSIKREYIEYYYCTKCGNKAGNTWDIPKQ